MSVEGGDASTWDTGRASGCELTRPPAHASARVSHTLRSPRRSPVITTPSRSTAKELIILEFSSAKAGGPGGARLSYASSAVPDVAASTSVGSASEAKATFCTKAPPGTVKVCRVCAPAACTAQRRTVWSKAPLTRCCMPACQPTSLTVCWCPRRVSTCSSRDGRPRSQRRTVRSKLAEATHLPRCPNTAAYTAALWPERSWRK
mmetsp:Transcript_10655/g.36175  ORF Transcript_10655/g.36175 Transcript_10655/m.36175 type:complete len:204 (-) Transcript_10655:415-1026(-)